MFTAKRNTKRWNILEQSYRIKTAVSMKLRGLLSAAMTSANGWIRILIFCFEAKLIKEPLGGGVCLRQAMSSSVFFLFLNLRTRRDN